MRKEVFVKRINSILTDNRNDRYIRNYKKGKLDFKSLYKKDYSERLFKKRTGRKNKDYDITFFLDVSGSMYEKVNYKYKEKTYNVSRLTASWVSLREILGLLDKIQGIRTRLVLFGDYQILLKDFHEKFDRTKIEKVIGVEMATREVFDIERGDESVDVNFYERNSYQYYRTNIKIRKSLKTKKNKWVIGGGTNLLFALELFPSKKDSDVTFIFTDGEVDDVKGTQKEIKRQKGIFYGIGLGTTTIFNLFDVHNAVMITDVSDMYDIIVDKLRRSIKRA